MEIKGILFNTDMVRAILDGRKTVTRRVIKYPHCGYFENDPPRGLIPSYKPGDILYVRETWAVLRNDHIKEYAYKSDEKWLVPKWRPSIHMPKEAARIWLKVTDVRVERLKDITDDGAKEEGANYGVGVAEKMRESAIDRFAKIWDSTIKKKDLPLYRWGANPWVWVIEFGRCEKPEEV